MWGNRQSIPEVVGPRKGFRVRVLLGLGGGEEVGGGWGVRASGVRGFTGSFKRPGPGFREVRGFGQDVYTAPVCNMSGPPESVKRSPCQCMRLCAKSIAPAQTCRSVRGSRA